MNKKGLGELHNERLVNNLIAAAQMRGIRNAENEKQDKKYRMEVGMLENEILRRLGFDMYRCFHELSFSEKLSRIKIAQILALIANDPYGFNFEINLKTLPSGGRKIIIKGTEGDLGRLQGNLNEVKLPTGTVNLRKIKKY